MNKVQFRLKRQKNEKTNTTTTTIGGDEDLEKSKSEEVIRRKDAEIAELKKLREDLLAARDSAC